jgi:Fe-S-cluster containining protein
MSRQQRRKLERELLKLAGNVRRDGLPLPHRPEATMALALAVRDELSDSNAAPRASKAAALIDRVFDLTMRKLPPAQRHPPVACTAGCTYCCHNVVMATAPEIFLAASEVRARRDQAFVTAVLGRCESMRPARDRGGRPPCPLLESDRCSVYGARPAVCRKHTSFAVSACKSDHEGRASQIPIRPFDQMVFEYCAVALRLALQNPDAEQRWLDGQDVFAGVPSQAKLPGIDEHATFIWSRLALDST